MTPLQEAETKFVLLMSVAKAMKERLKTEIKAKYLLVSPTLTDVVADKMAELDVETFMNQQQCKLMKEFIV